MNNTHVSRNVQRIAQAVGQCGPQTIMYGKCVAIEFTSVYKDKCADEFLKLKDCYLKAMKLK